MENRKKKIIIIGSGISGIGAGRWLIDNNINISTNISDSSNLNSSLNSNLNSSNSSTTTTTITGLNDIIILEGRNRIGGRIYTNNEYNCNIDLGAAWIHNYNQKHPIGILAKTLKLKFKESNDESSEVYDLNGKSYSDKQTTKTWYLMEKVLGKSIKSIRNENENESLEDRMFQFITSKQWSDPVFQSWFSILDFDLGSPINQVSPAAICQDWVHALDGDEDDHDMVLYETGYISILNGLISGDATKNSKMKPKYPSNINENDIIQESLNILLNHCVESITVHPLLLNENNHEIETTTRNYPVTITCKIQDPINPDNVRYETFEADRVIVTVPLGVLKSNSIQFNPPLSLSKQTAIQKAGFGNVVKIVMEFEKVFWSSQAEGLMIADTSLCSPHPSIYNENINENNNQRRPQLRGLCTYFWNVFSINGKKILITFGLGEAADIVDQMTDNELLELLLQRLKCLERNTQIRSKFQSETSPSPEFLQRYTPTRWMRTNWKDDPFSCGVYSHVSKGLTRETSKMVWEELGRPENEYLWFAGEATESSSLIRSSVHGAWLSGIRVAEGVANSLSQPIYTPGYNTFYKFF